MAGHDPHGSPNPLLNLEALAPDLDPESVRVLGYAAALGKEFEFNTLRAALEVDEEPLAEILEGLVHKGVFRELRGGDMYVFTKEDIMAAATRTLSSSRMRVVHKKIAEAYEKLYPDPSPSLIPEMGRHYYLGKMHEKSMLYNRYSATLARQNFSPDVAIQYLERVREDLASVEGDRRSEEADTLRELGDLYVATGDATKAEAAYAKSLELAQTSDETTRAFILLQMAEAAREMDKLSMVRNYCSEAIKQFEKSGHKKGLAMAHRMLSRAAFKEGDNEVGRHEIELTLFMLDPVEDAKDIGRCLIDLGNICSNSAREEDQKAAYRYWERAIEVLEPLKDYRELFRAHNNLAVQLSGGDSEYALRELEKALKYAELARDRRSIGWAHFNMVEFHLRLGHVKEAEEHNNAALNILSKVDDKTGMEQVRMNQGILAQNRGEFKEAERWFLDALERAVKLGYRGDVAEMHTRMALLYLETGEAAKASAELSTVETIGVENLVPQVKPFYNEAKKILSDQLKEREERNE